MVKSRLHSAGGLLATFSPASASASASASAKKSSPPQSEQSLIVRSKKRRRSMMDSGIGSFDCLALITTDTAVESKARFRSRPRAIEGDSTVTHNVNSCSTTPVRKRSGISISMSGKQALDTSELLKSSCVRDVSPRRNRYNPPRKVYERFNELSIENTAQSPNIDIGVDAVRQKSKNRASGKSDTRGKDCMIKKRTIGFATEPDINKTFSQDTDQSIYVTPTKKIIETEQTNVEALSSLTGSIHNEVNPSKSKLGKTVVTPSPSEKTDSLSTSDLACSKGKHIDSDACSKISKGHVTKRKKLKRVSKLRNNGTKKPQVVLTKAITVGKKTIPARQIVKIKKAKIPLVKKIQTHRQSAKTSWTLKQNKSTSTSSKEAAMKTTNNEKHGSLTKRSEIAPTEQPVTIKAKKRLELIPHEKKDVPYLNGIPKRNLTVPKPSKKDALLEYIAGLMIDLETLKEDVSKTDERNIIDLLEIKRDFIPLSKVDLFVDCKEKGTPRRRRSKLASSSRQSRDLTSTPIRMTHPSSLPFFSTHMSSRSKAAFSSFPELDFGDDESACESVIDLGTISNSQALVSYKRKGATEESGINSSSTNNNSSNDSNNNSSNSSSNKKDDDCDSVPPITKPIKYQGGKSRINNGGSDILATFGCTTSSQEKKASASTSTSVSKTTLSLSPRSKISTLKKPRKVHVPRLDPQMNSLQGNRNPVSSRATNKEMDDPFEKLFAMDHDDLIEEELKKWVHLPMSHHSTSVKTGTNETNGDDDDDDDGDDDDDDDDLASSSSDESMEDDMLLNIPTLAY